MKIIKAHPVLSSTNKNIGGELMKKIRISFTISIPLKQTDIHWIEEGVIKKEGRGIYGGDERGYKMSSVLIAGCH